MPSQEIVEIFRNHGVNITADDSSMKLVKALKEENPATLWPMLEEFTNNKPIGLDGCNETMHHYTLQYALVRAFEQNRDSITQDDLDAAREDAAKLAESLSHGSSTRDDEIVQNDSENEDNQSNVAKPKKTRKRNRNLYPMILSLVEDNMKATPNEILEMVKERDPAANDSTVKVYYSKARNELNLPKIGKRGRKGSGIYDKIKALIEANPNVERAEMIERIVNELGAKVGTAQAYYSKAMKELS